MFNNLSKTLGGILGLSQRDKEEERRKKAQQFASKYNLPAQSQSQTMGHSNSSISTKTLSNVNRPNNQPSNRTTSSVTKPATTQNLTFQAPATQKAPSAPSETKKPAQKLSFSSNQQNIAKVPTFLSQSEKNNNVAQSVQPKKTEEPSFRTTGLRTVRVATAPEAVKEYKVPYWGNYYKKELQRVDGSSGFTEKAINADSISVRAELAARQRALRDMKTILGSEKYYTAPVVRSDTTEMADLADANARQSKINTKNMQSPNVLHNVATAGQRLIGEGAGNLVFGSSRDDTGLQSALRFAINLPGGMATAATNAPNNISRAITGKGIDAEGNEQNLSFLQRVGAAIETGVDVAGLFTGGSATLLSNIGKSGVKQITKVLAEQSISTIAKNIAKEIGKDAAEEFFEEAIQNVAGELNENGQIDGDTLGRTLYAGALGAVGGAIMSGAGQAIGGAKSAIRNLSANPNTNTNEREVSNGLNSRITDVMNQTLPVPNQGLTKERPQLMTVADNLYRTASDAAHKIADLITGKRNKVTLASLENGESTKYNKALGKDTYRATLVVDQNNIRHLDNSGHLTGYGRDGNDLRPLSPEDISNMPSVFKSPDVVKSLGDGREGARVLIEKQIDNRHRIVAEYVLNGNEFRLVTGYNVNKRPLSGTSADSRITPQSTPSIQMSNASGTTPEADLADGLSVAQAGQDVNNANISNSDASIANIAAKTGIQMTDQPSVAFDKLDQALESGAITADEYGDFGEALTQQYANSSQTVAVGGSDSTLAQEINNNVAQSEEDNIALAEQLQRQALESNAYARDNRNEQSPAQPTGIIKNLKNNAITSQNTERLYSRGQRRMIRDEVDNIIQQRYPDLVEKVAYGAWIGNDIDSDLVAGAKFKPSQLKQIYGSNFREFVPNALIGTEQRGVSLDDIANAMSMARNEDISTITNEDALNAAIHYYDNRQETRQQSHQLRDLYNDPAIRAEAIGLLESGNTAAGIDFELIGNQAAERVAKRLPIEPEGFTNVPLVGKNTAYNRGNLYNMTKIDAGSETSREIDGYRQHTKRLKNGKVNVQFERQGADGKWRPVNRAAYTYAADKSAVDEVKNNKAVQDALLQARQDGMVYDFVGSRNNDAYLDVKNDITSIVTPLKGEFTIDGGLVRDPNTGEILGNHIQVTPFGVVQQVGGKYNVLDLEDIDMIQSARRKLKTGIGDNFARTLRSLAPDEVTYNQLFDKYIGNKIKAEASYRSELSERLKGFENQANEVMKSKPKNVKTDEFKTDIFKYSEGKFTYNTDVNKGIQDSYTMLVDKYGKTTADAINEFSKYTRKVYDDVLNEVNIEYRRLGREEVPKRQDYMTHLADKSLMDELGISPAMIENLTGVQGDYMSTNRGSIPDTMVGISESTRPNTKFNPFFQRRTGSESATDPFRAVETYLTAALYNRHMTEPTMIARSLESSLRTSAAISTNQTGENSANIKKMPEEFQKAAKSFAGAQADGFMEAVNAYANALAGKSTPADRWMLNRPTTRKALRGLSLIQRINGANKIMGNFSSTLNQALNIPNTLSSNDISSAAKAVWGNLFDKNVKKAMEQSNFLKSRYTDVNGKYSTSSLDKISKKVSDLTAMNLVERAFVEASWGTAYQQALKDGLTGAEAIAAADRSTYRTVGARGVADMPEMYRSTIGRTFLQFTYETNETYRNLKENGLSRSGLWKSAKYFIAATAMNQLMKAITGREPLPDLIMAGVDTAKDLLNSDDDEDQPNDALQTTQRISELFTKLNPFANAFFSNTMDKNARQLAFGTDSDLGRYEANNLGGTVGELGGLFLNTIGGNIDAAGQNVLGLIPAGNQIRKTTQGTQNAIENEADAINTAKGVLFGKNSMSAPEKQTGIIKNLKSGDGIENTVNADNSGVTNEQYQAAMASKSNNRGNPDYSDSLQKLNDDKTIKLAEGEWKLNSDGVVTNQNGEVNHNFYKDVIRLQGGGDYQLYKDAYNLPSVSENAGVVTGTTTNEKLNNLSNNKTQSDVITKAINLQKSSEYADMPEWVKEEYARESGIDTDNTNYFGTSDYGYAVMASYAIADKKPVIYDDINNLGSHDEVINYLVNGRAKSAANDYWVTTGVVDDLYNDGYITKDEQKWLKNINNVTGGQISYSSKASSSGGSGSKSKKIPVADLSLPSLPSITSLGKNFASGKPDFAPTTNQGRGIIKNIVAPKIQTEAVIEPLRRMNVR